MRYLKLLTVFSLLVLIALCVAGCGSTPDWQALYVERLGQQIKELDTSYLNRAFKDPVESGSLTRVSWARLRNGETVLLGLPPYSQVERLGAEVVVERTVVLKQETWRDACARALDEEEVWGWRMPHAHRGNSIRIYVNNRRDAYCEFFFLPQGWELRSVHSHGILKSRAMK